MGARGPGAADRPMAPAPRSPSVSDEPCHPPQGRLGALQHHDRVEQRGRRIARSRALAALRGGSVTPFKPPFARGRAPRRDAGSDVRSPGGRSAFSLPGRSSPRRSFARSTRCRPCARCCRRSSSRRSRWGRSIYSAGRGSDVPGRTPSPCRPWPFSWAGPEVPVSGPVAKSDYRLGLDWFLLDLLVVGLVFIPLRARSFASA